MPEKKDPKKIVDVVQIVRHGEKLLVPEAMSLDRAIEVLQRQKVYEEQDVAINLTFSAFPWDGAVALAKALQRKFGWADYVPTETETMFGKQVDPPAMIEIATGPNKHELVPWGQIKIPGVTGSIQTTAVPVNDGSGNRWLFAIQGVVKRKHEHIVAEIADFVRGILANESIYRGQAIRIRFRADNGTNLPLPDPKFMLLSGVHEGEMVFSERVDAAIRTSIFTPIERSDECRKAGIPLKRGVLLAGPFGVGKTLAAHVTAVKSVENRWSFVYCERAGELVDAIRFAQQYAPAVVFCEDIDRFVDEDRDVQTDTLLNVIDGIDAKDGELMVILTTNEVEKIHQSMLRPGRLDAVVYVEPPDARAVERLVRIYGRGLVPVEEDLRAVGQQLKGAIPAVIRECVERAKLSAIRLTAKGGDLVVTGEAMLEAATSMHMQLDLLKPKTVDERSDVEKAADALGKHLTGKLNGDNGMPKYTPDEVTVGQP
jgi:transitional endoplasmic reticulum ATPase